jgi:hypothetical protein
MAAVVKLLQLSDRYSTDKHITPDEERPVLPMRSMPLDWLGCLPHARCLSAIASAPGPTSAASREPVATIDAPI